MSGENKVKKNFSLTLVWSKTKKINPEAFIWVLGLIVLGAINPYGVEHFSICPVKNLGFNYCPGCGLGHSVSYLFHGNIQQSIHTHLLGIPAVLILSSRIFTIVKRSTGKI